MISYKKKEKIEFPADWKYRIITENNQKILKDIESLLISFGIDEKPVQNLTSSSGKYLSYSLNVTFPSREFMETLSSQLEQIKGVKFLL